MQRRDGAYRLYLIAAVLLVAVVPLLRMLVVGLLEPSALAWLTSEGFAQQLRWSAAVIIPLGLLIGSTRGPAVLSPFETVTRASNQLRRRETLRAPFLRALGAGVVLAATVVVVIGSAVVLGADANPLSVAVWGLSVGTVAGLGVVASLLGQLLGTRRAWCVASWAAIVGVAPFGPGGLIEVLWRGVVSSSGARPLEASASASAPASAFASVSPVAVAALLGLALAFGGALASVPWLLDRLRGEALLAQALRREASSMALRSGEPSGAAAAYRELPAGGRRLVAVVGGWRPLSVFVRDAVGAARTPQRTVLGLAGLVAAALLLGLAAAPGAAMGSAAFLAAVASGAVFLSMGAFTAGFVHAADVAAAAPLFGWSPSVDFLLHGVFPVVVVLLVVGAASCLLGAGAAPVLAALASVAPRAFEAARGFLPPILLTPMPSEMGDLSVLARLAWQLDSLLAAMALGTVAVLLWACALPALALLAVALGSGALVVATRARLRQGRGERTS